MGKHSTSDEDGTDFDFIYSETIQRLEEQHREALPNDTKGESD